MMNTFYSRCDLCYSFYCICNLLIISCGGKDFENVCRKGVGGNNFFLVSGQGVLRLLRNALNVLQQQKLNFKK